MAYARKAYQRGRSQRFFLCFFVPAIIVFYTYLKWPRFMIEAGLLDREETLYLFGKEPAFWYLSLYTLIVCSIAGIILARGKSPYNPKKGSRLTGYQRGKFSLIFTSQLLCFYFIPFILPALRRPGSFWSDPVTHHAKTAIIYVSPAFTNWGAFFWVFILIPVVVYWFGKRYCSWYCACGNLAETVGTTKWGNAWVRHETPTGDRATKMQGLQTFFMALGMIYGIILFMDILGILRSGNLHEIGRRYQDFVIDFVFGSLIGIGAYPFYGTRIWCRYGCPLAKFMELLGRYGRSRYRVQANANCKGLGLCSPQCPMGIDVQSFAHKDKKPILGSFGLWNTACIGCGGCVDRCPTNALSFVSPFGKRLPRS